MSEKHGGRVNIKKKIKKLRKKHSNNTRHNTQNDNDRQKKEQKLKSTKNNPSRLNKGEGGENTIRGPRLILNDKKQNISNTDASTRWYNKKPTGQ